MKVMLAFETGKNADLIIDNEDGKIFCLSSIRKIPAN